MLETQVQFLSWEDHLRKKMAIYSSILAWRIPKTEDPGRLQSMWLPRSRHNWVAEQQQTDLPLTDFHVGLWRLLPWKPNKTSPTSEKLFQPLMISLSSRLRIFSSWVCPTCYQIHFSLSYNISLSYHKNTKEIIRFLFFIFVL